MEGCGTGETAEKDLTALFITIFVYFYFGLFFLFFFLLLLFCLLQHKNKSLHTVFFCVFHADNTIFFFVSSN